MVFSDIGHVVDYILRYIADIAWPVVVVFGIFLFRKDISNLLALLDKVKFPGGEASFRRKLEEVSEDLRQSEEARDAAKLPAQKTYSIRDLEAVSPLGTVLQSWLAVERRLRELAREKGVSDDKRVSTSHVIRALHQHGTLSKALADLLHDLRRVRNEAVHLKENTITRQMAREYARNSIKALRWIDRRAAGVIPLGALQD